MPQYTTGLDGRGLCSVLDADRISHDFILGLIWAGVGLSNATPNSSVRHLPTPPSHSLTPSGYPTIQLISDAVYLEIALDPTG